MKLRSGVPQGSCLSPTLFTLYNSDIPNPSGKNEVIYFADEVTQIIIYEGK